MKENKGFSLVELIIVIAIMAILVGVMAPQLIKYIEKTNVSADVQLCDSVKTAVVIAMSDPTVLSSTDYSLNHINSILTASPGVRIDSFSGNTVFALAVRETLGFNVFDIDELRANIKSSPAKDSAIMCIQGLPGGGGVAVWIDHSDMSGQKGDYTADDISELESSGVIYVD